MNRIKKGLFWSFADSYGSYLLKFFFTIFIARILQPSDYGLVAMLSLFLAIATWISESGFISYVVYKQDAKDEDFSTGFIFTVLTSLLFSIIFYFSASTIAEFYHEPRLINVTKVISLLLVFNAFGMPGNAKLIKEINFKKQALVNFIATIISGGIGLTIALVYKNYWALVIQQICGSLVRSIGFYFASKWFPKISFNKNVFKEQIKFGYSMFLMGMFDSISNEIYNVAIGKSFSSRQLGFFANGRRFRDMFVNQLAFSFTKVFFPSFAELNSDAELLKKSYNKSYSLVLVVSSTIVIFLILIMKEFILIFLTAKWLPAVIIIQIFLFEGFFYPLFMLNQNLFIAMGKPQKGFYITLFQKIISIILLFVFINNGIIWVSIIWVASSFLGLIISEVFIFKSNFFEAKKLATFLPILLLTLIMILMVFVFNKIGFSLLLGASLKILILFFLVILMGRVFRITEFITVLNKINLVFHRIKK